MPPLEFRAKKSFGQHFLVRREAISRIVANTTDCDALTLLEIGPGGGAITGSLLEDGRPLFAMELDEEAGVVLRERLRSTSVEQRVSIF